MNSQLNRRDFLRTSAAGLSFAFTLAADPRALIGEAEAADAPLSATAWVTIAPDGAITIVSPAAEMGQGSFTTLPAIIAEELDADWSTVVIEQAPTDDRYGRLNTFGSRSIVSMWDTLRQDQRAPLLNRAAQGLFPVGDLARLIGLIGLADAGITLPSDPLAANARAKRRRAIDPSRRCGCGRERPLVRRTRHPADESTLGGLAREATR